MRAPTNAPACRSDSNHIRRRGAKSFVDDLVLSRGVVLSRADLFCDLLRLSPLTRRFVRFRRTYRHAGNARVDARLYARVYESAERSSIRRSLSLGGPTDGRPFGGFFFPIFFGVLRCPFLSRTLRISSIRVLRCPRSFRRESAGREARALESELPKLHRFSLFCKCAFRAC